MLKKLSLLMVVCSVISVHAEQALKPAVIVEQVQLSQVSPTFSNVGRVQASEKVALVARVSGVLEEASFIEGSQVKKGQLLFSIEQDPYQIQLQQAKADLAGVKAGLKQAQADLTRSQQLNRKGALSKAQLEIAEAKRDQAAAQVMQAKAGVKNAELQLSYTKIYSPITGRISKSTYSEGNIVSPNSNPLATVVNIDPVYVEMAVSEKLLIDVRTNGVDINTPQVVPSLVLANGAVYEQKGVFNFFDPAVDSATDTIKVRATFPNPKGILLPGEFVRVLVEEKNPSQALLVSQASVQRNKDGFFVMKVIDKDGNKVVEKAVVKMGEQYEGKWIVEEGVSDGDVIILEGLQKVQPGMEVTVSSPVKSEKE